VSASLLQCCQFFFLKQAMTVGGDGGDGGEWEVMQAIVCSVGC